MTRKIKTVEEMIRKSHITIVIGTILIFTVAIGSFVSLKLNSLNPDCVPFVTVIFYMVFCVLAQPDFINDEKLATLIDKTKNYNEAKKELVEILIFRHKITRSEKNEIETLIILEDNRKLSELVDSKIIDIISSTNK